MITKIIKSILPKVSVDIIRSSINILEENKKQKEINRKNKINLDNFFSNQGKKAIDLGSGNKKGNKELLTVDLSEQADLSIDLLEGIPIENEKIDFIYSSHFFEHFYTNQILIILEECFRVLKKGGELSICVPNGQYYIEPYFTNLELDKNIWLRYEPAAQIYSKIDYINYMAHLGGEHKHLFDLENLIAIQKSVGFHTVSQREFDPSIDLEARKYQSIYTIALK